MQRGTKYLAGGALTLALAGGGAGVAAAAASTTASPTATLTAATKSTVHSHHLRRAVERRLRTLLRHSVHADFIVRHDGAWVTVSVDRGKLDSATSSSISLTRRDGVDVSATITPSTKFFGVPEGRLASGDRVLVAQSGGNALDVLALAPRSSSSGTSAAS